MTTRTEIYKIASQVIMPECTAYRVLFMAITFTNGYEPLLSEKNYLYISKKMMRKIQEQLQFESIALLSATYQELVDLNQVLMNTHDGRLMFTTLTLATC